MCSAKDGFKEAEENFTKMVEKYKSPSALWLNAVETEIGLDARDLTRKILQGHVETRGDGDVGPVLTTMDGVILSHKRMFKKTMRTLFGEICITRVGYSLRGHANLFPLDALLNLPLSSYSYGLQRFIARRVSMSAFSEVLDLTREVTGVVIGPRQAIEIVENCAIDFDAYYAKLKTSAAPDVSSDSNELESNTQPLSIPNTSVASKVLSVTEDVVAPVLVLTTDGKGIVMRHESLRPETQKRASESKQKMKTRLAKGEKTNRKRMAQVASVYFIDRFIRTPSDIVDELKRENIQLKRPVPHDKRVWASVEKSAEEVIQAMFTEANSRDPQHKQEWVILVDGNKHQVGLVKSLSKKMSVNTVIILDVIHVIEYLWDAARVFVDEKNHIGCEEWVADKLERILNGEAGKVAGSIRMSAAKRQLTEAKHKTAKDCARYIANQKPYMNYVKYLKLGYPIATGVIEGACRYLIKDRMDITGARWTLLGAEAVLKLRSIVTSGDFDNYWDFHLQCEHGRNYGQIKMSEIRS